MKSLRIFYIAIVWLFYAMMLMPGRAIAQADQGLPVLGPGTAANTAKITWPGVTGRVYFIQISTNLQTWSYAPLVEFGSGANIAWQFSTTGGRTFIRLKYTENTDNLAGASGDLDGDGLTNLAEVATRFTDPFNPDSDGDGMPDGWEVQYGLNPLSGADAATDADVDTLSNFLEYQLGTKPNSTDSDGDAVSSNIATMGDLGEYNSGSNPARFDMPILSLMEYSREATLEDWREPAFADRHTWTAAGSYRNTYGSGKNGAGTTKLAWLNPTPWQSGTTAINANGASNSFFDEVPGAMAWGDAQSTGTTLHAWLRQTWSWEEPYRVHRIRARQIRYFLKASRPMPIELKARAIVTQFSRLGFLDAAWTSAGTVETNTLTLSANQTDSNEFLLNPATYSSVTPWATTDANPRTAGDTYFTVSIKEFPYSPTSTDSDGDGLPNSIEASIGTPSNNADTDGDGRKDLLDFVSTRPGALATTTGPRPTPSSPTSEEEPVIEYVWRTGHICPTFHFSKNSSDINTIGIYGDHWDLGAKRKNLDTAPATPTQAMKDFWALSPVFQLALPGVNAPPSSIVDESKDMSKILRSYNETSYFTTGSPPATWKGADSKETMFRLRRETASPKAVSRTFLLIDREKADTTSATWVYNSVTPYTITIDANQTTSPLITVPANPTKLPDEVTPPPPSGKKSMHEVLAATVEVLQHPIDAQEVTGIPPVNSGPIRFCRWIAAYPPPLGSRVSDFADKDNDRFQIRVAGIFPEITKMKIKAAGLNGAVINGVFQSKTTDGDYEVDMKQIDGSMVSEPILLVSDGDDDVTFNGKGTDNEKNDQTLLADFGSGITVTFPEMGNASKTFNAQQPIATVTLDMVYCYPKATGDPPLTVIPAPMTLLMNLQARKMQEIYRQIGIKVDGIAINRLLDFSTDWITANGPTDPANSLTGDETDGLMVLVKQVSAAPNKIRVGFVNAGLTESSDDTLISGKAEGIRKDPCLVSIAGPNDANRYNILAHEAGHSLGNKHFFLYKPNINHWIMREGAGTQWRNDSTAAKRWHRGDADFMKQTATPFYVPSP